MRIFVMVNLISELINIAGKIHHEKYNKISPAGIYPAMAGG